MNLKSSAEEFQKTFATATKLTPGQMNRLNELLYRAERSLIDADGLPRRPWYKHQIYAPGFYTGYGVKTLPGIREAIEQKAWKEAQQGIAVVANVIHNYTVQVRQGLALLNKPAF